MFKSYLLRHNHNIDVFTGSKFCIAFYQKLASALHEGGVDGFLLESMNCWDEAYFALEGVKIAKQV